MKSNHFWGRVVVVAASLLLVTGGAAFAQLQTGNVYGKVLDQQGAALPGVTVTLDTGAAQEVQVTNAQGEFRFLSLPPATMKLKAELQGFGTVEYPNVVITVGHNTTLEITMNSAVEDVITVTTESPLLDERKISTGATVSGTELQEIPTSRDPWSILSTTPGVLSDRINVGGNESGQQSVYVGPGSMGGNSVWSMDGVVMTDMAALGSSPSYYDFDAFQEMQVTTGGSDTTIATGGVVVNMVTKRGTNQWRGSGRFFDTPGGTEANTSFNNANLPPGQTTPTTSNIINKITDWGAEIGGPIVKDHLWIWGSYGDQRVNVTAFGGGINKADLPTYNGKVNAQLAASNSLTLFVLENNKTVQGRDAGPLRTQPTTWNQGRNGPMPTADKAEDTQIFGPNFYLTGLLSDVNGGFGLVPQGGIGPVSYLDADTVWHNTYVDYQVLRPQKQAKLDASSFFNIGSVSNELKYGASYRTVDSDSLSTWGPGLIENGALFGGAFGTDNLFAASRQENFGVRTTYTAGYAQDTLTAGNLTANIGVRYDLQRGHNLPEFEAANADAPTYLPAFAYGGGPIGFSWGDFTPRLGITYALGKDRDTLVRASYSRYADQLGAALAGFDNPDRVQTYYYFTTPGIGPGLPNPLTPAGFGYSPGVNISTGLPQNGNAISSNFSAPLTDEVLASIEHSLLPELVVGLNLTYRHLTNQIPADNLGGAGIPLIFNDPNPFDPATLNSVGTPATAADFTPITTTVTTTNGKQQSFTYYVLNPNVSTREGAFLNNSGPDSTYKGASLTLNKRLSQHWMMRGSFTYSDWTYGSNSLPDQTDFLPGGNHDGDEVLIQSAGSGPKQFVFINSKWSANVNGMYQVAPDRGWGFNLAGAFSARQGYPIPNFVQVNEGSNYGGLSRPDVLVGTPDEQRLPTLTDFDARIEKEFTFQDFGLTLSVDCFNLFNSSTVLQRVSQLGNVTGTSLTSQGNANYINEILAPRVYRFGVRLSFR
jgi:hypothetical protein